MSPCCRYAQGSMVNLGPHASRAIVVLLYRQAVTSLCRVRCPLLKARPASSLPPSSPQANRQSPMRLVLQPKLAFALFYRLVASTEVHQPEACRHFVSRLGSSALIFLSVLVTRSSIGNRIQHVRWQFSLDPQHQVSSARRAASHTSLNEHQHHPRAVTSVHKQGPENASRSFRVAQPYIPSQRYCCVPIPFPFSWRFPRFGNSTLAHKDVSDRYYSLLQSTIFFSLGSLL